MGSPEHITVDPFYKSIAMTEPANDDGNCLPSHHDDTRGVSSGFQRVENYDACEDDHSSTTFSNDENEEEMIADLSLNELMYSAHSFHVISLPVSITMILAALAVTYVNTPETIKQGAALMNSAYHAFEVNTNDSTSKQLFLDFANGLVIVTVIGTMTFGIVLLYKYRCMKVLIGYMMISSMTLLGVLGGELFSIAIAKYRIPIDWFTFVFVLYNFAVVGVTAIFYQAGIPSYITQGYLICSSVIISWQLSHFDTMSTWTLLIMLGLYDLCAVLTPCGPLRFLVNLMSDEGAPEMPGLLYEAEIPEGLKRPVMQGRDTNGGNDQGDDDASKSPPSSMTADRYEQPSATHGSEHDDTIAPGRTQSDVSGYSASSSGDVEMSSTLGNGTANTSNGHAEQATSTEQPVALNREQSNNSVTSERSATTPRTAMVPFAIAKLYKLPLTTPPFQPGKKRSPRRKRSIKPENVSISPLLNSDSAEKDDGSVVSEESTPYEPYVIPDGEYTIGK